MSEALIARLAAEAAPVRRLRPAWMRAAGVLLPALALLGVLFLWHGARADLTAAWAQPGFALRLAATGATAIAGMLAAAELAVPGRSRLWLAAPLAGLALWIVGIGRTCTGAWVAFDAAAMDPGEAQACLCTVALIGSLVIGVMLLLLRRAAPLRPLPCSLAAGLAAAGAAGFALTLLHPMDASLMLLAWNAGATLVLVTLQALFGAAWLRR